MAKAVVSGQSHALPSPRLNDERCGEWVYIFLSLCSLRSWTDGPPRHLAFRTSFANFGHLFAYRCVFFLGKPPNASMPKFDREWDEFFSSILLAIERSNTFLATSHVTGQLPLIQCGFSISETKDAKDEAKWHIVQPVLQSYSNPLGFDASRMDTHRSSRPTTTEDEKQKKRLAHLITQPEDSLLALQTIAGKDFVSLCFSRCLPICDLLIPILKKNRKKPGLRSGRQPMMLSDIVWRYKPICVLLGSSLIPNRVAPMSDRMQIF